jgi:predicted amidohydrolase
MLTFALAQMRCEKAATAENLAAIARVYQQADQQGATIVACPEMSLTGYIDPTRRPEAILRLDGPEVAALVALTAKRRATLLAGLVEANPQGKPYITQVAARAGRLVGLYRKVTIVDEEAAWFAPGEAIPVCQHDDLTYGIAICADIHNREVFAACAQQGAQVVFEVAAPGLYGEQATRDWRSGYEWWRGECRQYLTAYARDYGLWIAVATQAGRTMDEDFPGGGYLYRPDGECVYETADGSEGVALVTAGLATQTDANKALGRGDRPR